MARQRRDEDDYDDDDFLPPEQSGESSRRGRSKWVFVAMAVCGLVVGTMVVVFLLRTQRALERVRVQVGQSEQNVAVAQQANPLRPRPRPNPPDKGLLDAPNATWERFVGTWHLSDGRTPAAESPRYTFNSDRTATWTLPAAALGSGQTMDSVTRYRITEVRVIGDEIRLGVLVQHKGQEINPDEFVCRFAGGNLLIVPASQLRLVPGRPGDTYVRQ